MKKRIIVGIIIVGVFTGILILALYAGYRYRLWHYNLDGVVDREGFLKGGVSNVAQNNVMESESDQKTGRSEDEWRLSGDSESSETLQDGSDHTLTSDFDSEIQGVEVTQHGPYGSITITIPEGWNYDLLPMEDERLLSGDYGFHLYPADAKNGYVELAYHSWFGVCGTGLVQEEAVLAGDSASVGYYDGSKDWSYIAYQGKNEKIVAMVSYDAEWMEEYNDQLMDILDTMQYDPNVQTGAVGVYDPDSEIPSLGITISAKQISKAQAVVVIRQYEPEIDAEMWFGEEFQLEKRDGDDWIAVPFAVKGEYGFHDIAYTISLDDTTEHEYNWEWLYGSLEPGEYRIGIRIYARGTGVEEEYPVYAHFMIR